MSCDANNPNPPASAPGQQARGFNSIGNAPTNEVGPYFKNIDTIPPGETRQQFSLTAGLNQIVFTNQKSAAIEVCEVFFQSVGGNVVTLSAGGIPITPAIKLLDTQGYTDSGFVLPTNAQISISVAGAGTVGGFVRWRYQ